MLRPRRGREPAAEESEGRWLVVGLGNPGPAYSGNRHNVGFMVADLLADRMSARFKAHKTRAEIVEGRLAGERVVLAKPRSYMNESGGPVTALLDFFKVPLDRLVVVHDELDLPFGGLRLKLGGGDNGHNGLKAVRRSLGTGEFHRVRIGIGRPPGRMEPATFVLRDFSGTERKELDLEVDRAADAIEELIAHGLDLAQNAFNT
ncbi:MAG TPA: aminoacyl-tRNA hydrolase [Actinomycetes bacterium]